MDLHNPASRLEFFALVRNLVSDGNGGGGDRGLREKLIELSSGNATLRDTVSLVGTYAAYLAAAQDGDFRGAYDLLYDTYTFGVEARAWEKEQGEQRDEWQQPSRQEEEQDEDDDIGGKIYGQ